MSAAVSNILCVYRRAIDYREFIGCSGPSEVIRQSELVQFRLVH